MIKMFLDSDCTTIAEVFNRSAILSLYVTENGCDLEDIDIVLDKLNFHEYDFR